MSRRRRREKVEVLHFEGASTGIFIMERAVIYRSVDTPFSASELVDCLFPAESLAKLRAAFPVAYTEGLPGQGYEELMLNGARVKFGVSFHELGLLRPHGNPVLQNSAAKFAEVSAALHEVVQIVDDFNVIRSIVDWFHDHKVTPGCARYYFPGLCTLLPRDHVINQVDSTRFRDIVLDSQIAGLLRRAPEIIARGLLTDPDHSGAMRSDCNIRLQINDGQNFAFI